MGYTHYWTPNKNVTEENFKQFVTTCKTLLKNLPETSETAGGYSSDDTIKICGWDGTGKPKLNESVVSFNGDAENGLDHETFSIEHPERESWNFCKTARKPYDLLVCACLIAAHEYLNYEVRSDGDLADWQPAIDFYLNTIYDFTDTNEEDKIEIVHNILPDFLVKEMESYKE